MQTNNNKSTENRVINFTVLIPVHKAELFEALLPPAIEAAKKYDGKVLLLNIIEKPYLASPQKAEEKRSKRKSLLSKGMKKLQEAGCKCEIQIEISPDISGAIKRIAQSRNVNLIIMGSNGNQYAFFKNEIPYKLQQLDCAIIVARETVKSQFNRIFVFVDRLYNVPSMLEHASFLVSSEESTLHIVHDFEETGLNEELDTLLEQIDTFKKDNLEFSEEIIHSRIAETAGKPIDISAEDEKNSCVLIRYRGNWLEQLMRMHRNEPDVIAESTGLPILVYKPKKY